MPPQTVAPHGLIMPATSSRPESFVPPVRQQARDDPKEGDTVVAMVRGNETHAQVLKRDQGRLRVEISGTQTTSWITMADVRAVLPASGAAVQPASES